jgi:hypothetical protein
MTPCPEYLIDGWPDGHIEEHAWVEVTTATDSEQKAIAFLEKEMPIEDSFPDEPEGMLHYRVTGQEWQKPLGFPVPGSFEVRSEHPLDQYGDCSWCKGTAKVTVIDKLELASTPTAQDAASRLAAPPNAEAHEGMVLTEDRHRRITRAGMAVTRTHKEDCDGCHATGKDADWIHGDEGWPWEACEEGADEGKLFWKLEVSDEPDPRVNVSDEQTTLPET